MIGHIKVRERGATPKNIRGQWRPMAKRTWLDTGEWFHRQYVPKRFTHEGARELGYKRRKGELQKGQPGYFRTYTGRKERRFGHTLPLVWSGESRALARIRDVRATSNGAKIVLNARKLNLRNPKSYIYMALEIRRVSPRETRETARQFDTTIDRELQSINATTVREL